MTLGFSTAADWLSNISGPNARAQIEEKDESRDLMLRDLRGMKDAETRGIARSLPPPKLYGRLPGPNARAQNRSLQQPKPKFVAHKDPTRGKKGKDRAQSNRLGNDLHMA